MAIIRIQEGHYGRTRGATGAYNSRLNIREADMNHELMLEIKRLVDLGYGGPHTFQFIGPDERLYSACGMFISLHMDGNNSGSIDKQSVGYPPSSKESKAFAGIFKTHYNKIPGAGAWRGDNYTTALQKYYGYKSSYSHYAPVKLVIENGFVTNDTEARWAIKHRTDVAMAILDSIHTYYGTSHRNSISTRTSTVSTSEDLQPYQSAAIGGDYTKIWQFLLEARGFNPGAIDGIVGDRTRLAHKAFCVANDLPVTASPGRRQWKLLVTPKTQQASDATLVTALGAMRARAEEAEQEVDALELERDQQGVELNTARTQLTEARSELGRLSEVVTGIKALLR